MYKNEKKIIIFLFLVGFTFLFLLDNVFAADCDLSIEVDCDGFCVPNQLVTIVGSIVTIIKIGVPVILIVLGMIDLGKSVATQKEEDIKKGQKTLMSRCIAAAIVFFVVAIVQLLFSIINGTTAGNDIWSCIDSFVNGTLG